MWRCPTSPAICDLPRWELPVEDQSAAGAVGEADEEHSVEPDARPVERFAQGGQVCVVLAEDRAVQVARQDLGRRAAVPVAESVQVRLVRQLRPASCRELGWAGQTDDPEAHVVGRQAGAQQCLVDEGKHRLVAGQRAGSHCRRRRPMSGSRPGRPRCRRPGHGRLGRPPPSSSVPPGWTTVARADLAMCCPGRAPGPSRT